MVKCSILLFLFNFFLFCVPAELFYLSHKLVDLYPNNPVSDAIKSIMIISLYNLSYFQKTNKKALCQVSWFAVGCYYLMVGHKNEHARRYLRFVFAHSK